MENWQLALRHGVFPLLGDGALEAVADVLRNHPDWLLRKETFSLGKGRQGGEVVATCPLAWAGWTAEDYHDADELEDWFDHLTDEADKRLRELFPAETIDQAKHLPRTHSFFEEWDDEELSPEELLAEVESELASRGLLELPPGNLCENGKGSSSPLVAVPAPGAF